ncbi:MAG TPA: helix-turn-helix domain-containing protein [Candidatus Saccharimonadia bacterium]|nr:helix-turn-helix domain-containing protein [Candidatus Saccharimonadia bacterium]
MSPTSTKSAELSQRSGPLLDARQSQQDFFLRMGHAQEVRFLFNHLDGVTFFMKDLEGRFMAMGEGPKRRFDHGTEEENLGRTDYDLYPKHIADSVREDDLLVMRSDAPVLNIVELLVNPGNKSVEWYVTNKFPVHDQSGHVIGVMGTVQLYDGGRRKLLEGTRLDDVVEHIRKNPAASHSMEELARMAAMSERQLERKFRDILGMPPREFITRNRMKLACDELAHTSKPIVEVALECGFSDQSAFATQFRRAIGVAPLKFRQRYLTESQGRRLDRIN